MPVTGPPAELSRGLVSTRWNARAAAARALTALVRAEHGCDGRVQQASASPAAPATASAWAVRAGAERATARSQSRTVGVGAPAAAAGKAPGGQQDMGDATGTAASPVRAQPTPLATGQLNVSGPRRRPNP